MSARLVKLKEIEKYGWNVGDDEDPNNITLMAGDQFIASWSSDNRPFDEHFINILIDTAYEAGIRVGREANQKEIKTALGI
jgi:hypothetical protein